MLDLQVGQDKNFYLPYLHKKGSSLLFSAAYYNTVEEIIIQNIALDAMAYGQGTAYNDVNRCSQSCARKRSNPNSAYY